METSLQNINPEEINDFFKHICFVINEHKEGEEAIRELHNQIKKIKTAPKKWIFEKEVDGLHDKIDKVVIAKKNLFAYKDNAKLISQLNDKINFLEEQFDKVKTERDNVLLENREKINEIQDSLKYMRSRISEFSRAKEERDKKLRELEKRAKKVVS